MTGVITLFGETDLQSSLKKPFMQNELLFVCKNAETSVQLIGFVEEHLKETDAVVISAGAVLLETIFDLADSIIELKHDIRIVVILNGNRSQYLKNQLSDFRQRQIDIVFDDRGFDVESLIRFLKKGPVLRKPEKNISEQFLHEEEDMSSEFIEESVDDILNVKDNNHIQQEDEDWETEDDLPESFSQFRGHYSIGIMGAAHGTGVTSLAVELAEYFSLHNCSVALVDYTGTDAIALAKLKEAEYIAETQSMRQLKKKYNLVIFDFGAPYVITPKGDNFIVEHGYPIMNLPEFNKCNIKIIMGFSDSWNIRKMGYFLENNQWKSVIDSSFLFVTADKAYKLQRRHPDVNIVDRCENITDMIYEIIKQEELK